MDQPRQLTTYDRLINWIYEFVFLNPALFHGIRPTRLNPPRAQLTISVDAVAVPSSGVAAVFSSCSADLTHGHGGGQASGGRPIGSVTGRQRMFIFDSSSSILISVLA